MNLQHLICKLGNKIEAMKKVSVLKTHRADEIMCRAIAVAAAIMSTDSFLLPFHDSDSNRFEYV